MLRDNLVGLIEPMRAAREVNPLALFTEQKTSSDDRPQDALKIPAPKGRNLTLTENAASPFHAEPRQNDLLRRPRSLRLQRFLETHPKAIRRVSQRVA